VYIIRQSTKNTFFVTVQFLIINFNFIFIFCGVVAKEIRFCFELFKKSDFYLTTPNTILRYSLLLSFI